MKYTTSRSYGDARRIWMLKGVSLDHFGVHETLNDLSIWGGRDKDSDGLVSWEFNPAQFEEACSYLAGCGFGWVSNTQSL